MDSAAFADWKQISSRTKAKGTFIVYLDDRLDVMSDGPMGSRRARGMNAEQTFLFNIPVFTALPVTGESRQCQHFGRNAHTKLPYRL
jgi:hypothetical protein